MIWLISGVLLGLIVPLAVIPGTIRKVYNEDGRSAATKLYLATCAISVPGMVFFMLVAGFLLFES